MTEREKERERERERELWDGKRKDQVDQPKLLVGLRFVDNCFADIFNGFVFYHTRHNSILHRTYCIYKYNMHC